MASSSELCGICSESLLIPSDGEEGPSHVLDDVEVRCGNAHHFHWECILEYAQGGGDRARCPSCTQSTLNAEGQFLVDVRNEGGFTGGFDMGRELDEEDYLSVHPQEQNLQTFFDLIEQGDIGDAEEVLVTQALDVNARQEANGPTALHLAAGKNDGAAIKMLLRHGADKSITLNGSMPLDIAMAIGASEAAELLA